MNYNFKIIIIIKIYVFDYIVPCHYNEGNEEMLRDSDIPVNGMDKRFQTS